jgi:hypothetical protein
MYPFRAKAIKGNKNISLFTDNKNEIVNGLKNNSGASFKGLIFNIFEI